MGANTSTATPRTESEGNASGLNAGACEPLLRPEPPSPPPPPPPPRSSACAPPRSPGPAPPPPPPLAALGAKGAELGDMALHLDTAPGPLGARVACGWGRRGEGGVEWGA